jgi:hypothetical protein
MHCVFGFGIENHLHLGFKGKTFDYSFGLHGLCIALCLCVNQVASHLKIIYTFKSLNISPFNYNFHRFHSLICIHVFVLVSKVDPHIHYNN